ncbi:MAG: hypothetical protein J7513_13260 [Solirubrobacteraceae bacterium]|nr:hypothetical protein [Solirubrobacteraceae bacterium]
MTATKQATPTPARKTTLADLETEIAKAIAKTTSAVTVELIAKHGNSAVEAGELSGYTPKRYGQGRWVSAGVVARVTKLVDTMRPAAA